MLRVLNALFVIPVLDTSISLERHRLCTCYWHLYMETTAVWENMHGTCWSHIYRL